MCNGRATEQPKYAGRGTMGPAKFPPMRILIAPDKFKGSLTAQEAAHAIRRGMSKVLAGADFDISPIADGGEGTADIFLENLNGEKVQVPSHDALGREIVATYIWFEEDKLAVIEMSEASGLWRLQHDELNPMRATTFGTGELMADAMKRGAEKIFVTLGGSATNDAGIGVAEALGWKFYDATDNEMSPLPSNYAMIHRIEPPIAKMKCAISALSDVTNPLLGPNGATRVYGPQKGATPEMVDLLETGLANIADICWKQLGRDFRDIPGAGATGGLGYGLLTFCDATIEPGFNAVATLLGLEAKISHSDLVITGEGRLDSQTQQGKGPAEIARLATRHHKPVIAFAGVIEGAQPDFTACIPIADGPLALDESRLRAAELLETAAERTARLLKISL